VTGSSADTSCRFGRVDIALFAGPRAAKLGRGTREPADYTETCLNMLVRIVQKGAQHSLVIAASHRSAEMPALAHAINAAGNVGLRFITRSGGSGAVNQLDRCETFCADMDAGKVELSGDSGVNPVYTLRTILISLQAEEVHTSCT